jgi:predicted N-formylglutamate amidohydrolase
MNQSSYRLLATDEPDPVRVLREDGSSAFFLTVDHAGRRLPRRLGDLGVPESELVRHIAWDIGIAAVTERLSQAFDATAVMQIYSRLVIDCNRAIDVASAMPVISESTPIPGNVDISADERHARIQEIYRPYASRVSALLDARQAAGRKTILISMHSFTPVFKGVARPMHVGVLFNRDKRLGHALLDVLCDEKDIISADNEPYAVSDTSDYGIPVHGEERGLAHVELEIRQDLITDEAGQAEWAERLVRLLPQAVALMEKRNP